MNPWRQLVVVTLLGAVAYAQTDTGVVTGRVLNTQKQPVASTKVLVEKDGKEFVTGVTDSLGLFLFTLPAGAYVLKSSSTAAPLSVTGHQTTSVDLIQTPKSEPLQFFDEPQFTVAGVTDNTYRGGHGSDSVLRSSETLTKATAALSQQTITPDPGEPHHSRAEQEESSGQFLEAAGDFKKAAELNPSETNLFDWGTELLSHRASQVAAEVFTKGHSLHPQSLRMLLGLATAWYAAGSSDKAAHCFFEAIDNHPDDPTSYSFLNQVQSPEITQASGYLEKFARFVRLHPENALANYYYGASLWQQRQGADESAIFEQVRTYLTKAVVLDPHLAPAFVQLGIVEAAQGHHAYAIDALQKAVRENPDGEEAHYRLSEAYRLTGDRAQAEREMAIYQTLSQRSSENRERERRELRQFVIALKNTDH